MLKFIFILTLFTFGKHFCWAQKIIQKEFSAESISSLVILDDNIFKIEIKSSKNSEIILNVHISGEHSESVVIEEKIAQEKLTIHTGFAPFFNLENDKLSAHKIMAIEVELIIPEHISVEIKSKLATVEAEGKLINLAIFLENGNCALRNFLGNAHLETVVGNITVHAQNNVSGTAFSKFGTVENTLPKKGRFFIEAESNYGNISLLQTE